LHCETKGVFQRSSLRWRCSNSGNRETSTFFISSVAESIAVLAGDQRTPSGLLVAAR
jgi:hypothetical protein